MLMNVVPETNPARNIAPEPNEQRIDTVSTQTHQPDEAKRKIAFVPQILRCHRFATNVPAHK